MEKVCNNVRYVPECWIGQSGYVESKKIIDYIRPLVVDNPTNIFNNKYISSINIKNFRKDFLTSSGTLKQVYLTWGIGFVSPPPEAGEKHLLIFLIKSKSAIKP